MRETGGSLFVPSQSSIQAEKHDPVLPVIDNVCFPYLMLLDDGEREPDHDKPRPRQHCSYREKPAGLVQDSAPYVVISTYRHSSLLDNPASP